MKGFYGSQKGFSLIELITVIILVGVISLVVRPIFVSGFNAFFSLQQITDANTQAELAMARMVREIRTVDISDTSNGFDGTVVAHKGQADMARADSPGGAGQAGSTGQTDRRIAADHRVSKKRS